MSGRVLGRLAAGLLLVSAPVLGGIPAQAAAAPGSESGGVAQASLLNCPSMVVIGVRGSGEKESDDGGFGKTVDAVVKSILARDPTATALALDYPAIKVQFWRPSYYTKGYVDSVDKGIANLVAQIRALSGGPCWSRTSLYLAGYSQGADVVGDVYQDLDAASLHLTAAQHSHILGVAMLGDPRFSGAQGAPVDEGTYHKDKNGVAHLVGEGTRTIPASEAGHVRSYCMGNDPVCNYSAANALACGAGTVLNSHCVHLHYMNISPTKGGKVYTSLAASYLLSRRAAQPIGASDLLPDQVTPETLNGSYESVACVSSNACMTVGSYLTANGSRRPWSGEWTGSKWSTVAVPLPAGGVTGNLSAISCTALTSCLALGSYSDGSLSHMLAETWNGSAWKIAPVASQFSAALVEVDAMACVSATDCVAVGHTQQASQGGPVATTWNGSTWTPMAEPEVAGSIYSRLSGISCLSAADCVAVGYYTDSSYVVHALAERWDGSGWTDLHAVSSLAYPELTSVDCMSGSFCMAAGSTSTGSGNSTLSETWNGSSWTLANSLSATSFTSVSCTSSASCVAVGGSDGSEASAATWNGVRWTKTTPARHAAFSQLESISCTGPAWCLAVGETSTGPGGPAALTSAQRWNGASWSAITTFNLAGAANAELTAVSCTSDQFCVAVGWYEDSTGREFAFAQSWNGTRWTSMPAATPGSTTGSELDGIDCPTPKFCVAVGFLGNQSAPLAETWNGKAWQVTKTPISSRVAALDSVTCTSAKSCIAVGYLCPGGKHLTVALRWNGTTWSMQVTPNPPGVLFANLASIACVSARDCAAVGENENNMGIPSPIIERWNGAKWVIQAEPNHIQSGLTGIACPASNRCVAVGYRYANGVHTALADYWNGTKWAATAVPAGFSADLFAVSCVSAASCLAVGANSAVSNNDETLAELWNGSSWHLATSANAPVLDPAAGRRDTALNGISCRPLTACFSVGYATQSWGSWAFSGWVSLPLTERAS